MTKVGELAGRFGADAPKYFVAHLVPALLTLVTIPIYTSYLSSDEYGALALALAAVTLFSLPCSTWLVTSAVRFVPACQTREQTTSLATTQLAASTLAALVVAPAVALAAHALLSPDAEHLRSLIFVASGALFATSIFQVLISLLRAAGLATRYMQLDVTATVTGVVAAVALLASGYGARSILIGVGFGFGIAIVPTLLVVGRGLGLSPTAIDWSIASKHAAFGGPILVSHMLYWALWSSDRYVVEVFRGASEVGIYTFGHAIAEHGLRLIAVPLIVTMNPLIVAAWEANGEDDTRSLVERYVRYYLVAAVPATVGLAVIAPTLVSVLAGKAEYHVSHVVIAPVAASVALYGLAEIASRSLYLRQQTGVVLQNTAIAVALNIGLNVALVPRYGYVAAAATTLAATSVLFALAWWRGHARLSWQFPWDAALRVMASTTVMGAGVAFLQLRLAPTVASLALLVLAGAVLYAALVAVQRKALVG